MGRERTLSKGLVLVRSSVLILSFLVLSTSSSARFIQSFNQSISQSHFYQLNDHLIINLKKTSATLWLLYFNLIKSSSQSLKHDRFTTSDCKDKGIRKLDFDASSFAENNQETFYIVL